MKKGKKSISFLRKKPPKSYYPIKGKKHRKGKKNLQRLILTIFLLIAGSREEKKHSLRGNNAPARKKKNVGGETSAKKQGLPGKFARQEKKGLWRPHRGGRFLVLRQMARHLTPLGPAERGKIGVVLLSASARHESRTVEALRMERASEKIAAWISRSMV